MIRVKKKINPKLLVSLILLCAFLVLICASVLMNIFLDGNGGGIVFNDPPFEVLEGEAVVGSTNPRNLAYPQIKETDVQYISVSDKSNSFKVARLEEDGALILYYTDANGDTEIYYPNILGIDENIDYETLYAIEQSDGLGMIPMISYLCSAVGYTAFQERIKLSLDSEKRRAQLESFGLAEGEYVTVDFIYTEEVENEDGETESKQKTHTLKIGKNNLSGAGRYFMVDDREYVYCEYVSYMDYALQGFAHFVKPYIVTKGMSGDESILAAYLTQDFKEWKNTVHKTPGEIVPEDSKLVASVQTVVPHEYPLDHKFGDGDSTDGYDYGKYEQTMLDFLLNAEKKDYVRMINALVGKPLGVYYDPNDPISSEKNAIIFTLTSQSRSIDFEKRDSVRYDYEILAIESVITDKEEITEQGAPVKDANLLKITYKYLVDGKAVSLGESHAVIDLEDTLVPEAVSEQLRGEKIGRLESSVKFSVDYTKTNAVKYDVEYVISDILEIYDKDGKPATEVAEDSIVVYRYYLVADGAIDEDVHVGTAALSATEGESEEIKNLRRVLVGKRVSSGLKLSVMTYTDYSETLYDFITYRAASLDYFVTSELVTSFGFLNASDRDPFYGESVYQNTMEGNYSLYGVNADNCLAVIKYFTGVSNDSSSATEANGLVGDETVAIGITPEVMEKYGLYAYTVYIEIPRGIEPLKDENYEDENALDNYGWRDTLGFYIYVSEKQYDGTRYIASDMYDLVAKIDGTAFDFLEMDFADFWARRNMLMLDFHAVENMQLEFNMSDVFGKYNFDIIHERVYVDEHGNATTVKPENVSYDEYVLSHINTTQQGNCMQTELSKYLEKNGGLDKSVSLTTLYNNVRGDGSMIMAGDDSLGSTSYKNLMYLLYGIYYTDTLDLTEEQKNEISERAPLMKMSVLIESSSYYYTYEFHRVDDRRIMVSLYRSTQDGVRLNEGVRDFYVSSFAFKKMARAFIGVLNAELIDAEVGYPARS